MTYNQSNSVSVFIGSSFKLMSYRNCVGNMLRQLNDRWEQQGVRLFLKRWEDFRTEFESQSKQQEYIDELALPSDICAFFFSDRIGKYTERELDACIDHKHKNIICFRVPGKQGEYSDSVKSQIVSKGLSVTDVANEQGLANELKQVIEAYIQNGHMTFGKVEAFSKSYYFYTTISYDISSVTDEFGTTIRSLDDFCEEYFGVRCRLHPLHQPDLLERTHHYTPYLGEKTREDDRLEFEKALTLLDEKKILKSITLFTKAGGKLLDNNPDIKELLDDKELFFCNVKGVDTIRWRLLSWIMRQEKVLVPAYAPELTMKCGYLYLKGRPMVSMNTLDQTGNATRLLSEIEKTETDVNAVLSLGDNQRNDKTIAELNHKKNQLQAQLFFQVSECVTNAIFGYINIAENAKQALDNGELDCLLEMAETGLDSLERQKHIILGLLKTQLESVTVQISSLCGKVENPKQADELKHMAEVREKLTRELVNYGAAAPEQLLSTQLFLVGVHDTYLHPRVPTPEEDAVFERILNDASRYGVRDIQVEMIRFNFANSFLRKEDYQRAQFLLKEAIGNIERIESKTWYVSRMKTMLYLRAYNAYREYGDRNGMTEMLTLFKRHVDRCMAISNDHIVDKAIYLGALLTSLHPDNDGEGNEVNDAMMVADWIDENLDIPVDDMWFGEVFIQFPNMIAAYLIDHRRGKPQQVVDWMNRLAIRYLDICEKNARKLMKESVSDGLFYLGEVFHQKGFFFYSLGSCHWHQAERCYEYSLHCKERLLKLEDDFSKEVLIAQTLVNWGAIKEGLLQLKVHGADVNLPDEKAEQMARRAVDIYQKHIMADNVISEQHYYEALQLLGTIHYYRGIIQGDRGLKDKGLAMLRECWAWNCDHPYNSYHLTFENNAGEILKKEELI